MPKFISDADMIKLEASVPKSKSFISDEDMMKMEAGSGQDSNISAPESALIGAGKGATLGFLDEAVGAIQNPLGAAKQAGNIIGQMLPESVNKGLGMTSEETDPDIIKYKQWRDMTRAAESKAQQANPSSYITGELAGGVAPMLIPGANSLVGMTNIGGVTALGQSTAEDLDTLGKEALVGELAGAAGYGAGILGGKALEKAAPYVSKGLEKVGAATRNKAEELAAKYVGASAKDFESGAAQRMGKRLLGNDAIAGLSDKASMRLFQSKKALLDVIKNDKADAGEVLGQLRKYIDIATSSSPEGVEISFNPERVANRLETELGKVYRTPINKQEWGTLDNVIESVRSRGTKPISLEKAQMLKEEIGSVAYPKGVKPVMPTDKQVMAQDAYRIINDEIENVYKVFSEADPMLNQALIEKIGIEPKDIFKFSKDMYGSNVNLERRLGSTVAKEQAGSAYDPISKGFKVVQAAAAPFTGGVTLGSLALQQGIESTLPHLPKIGAVGLNNISKVLKATPQVFGKFAPILQQAELRGPTALAAKHFLLGQTNPEYQQLILDQQKEKE